MKLFISYAQDDKAWVQELSRALRSELNHETWIDRELLPAQDWWGTILRQIRSCNCFLYVLSPQSVDSIYCSAEKEFALALNKPILPLILRACDYPADLTAKRIHYQIISDNLSMGRILLNIERSLEEIRSGKMQGHYEMVEAPRPPEPVPQPHSAQIAEVYMLAEAAAASNNPPLAEKLLKQVMEIDPQRWGRAAAERLAELSKERERSQDYAELLQMARNPAMTKDAQDAAERYVAKYGMDYDPKHLLFTLVTPTAPFNVAPLPFSKAAPAPSVDVVASPTVPRPLQQGEVRMDRYGVPMVYVPAGKFLMGSDPRRDRDAQKNEVPQHEIVFVQGFWIDQFPVTNEAFAAFLKAADYRDGQWWTAVGWRWVRENKKSGPSNYDGFTRPMQPRVGVTGYEAMAYAKWRGARLPTEAEWEYAARGPQNLIYPWGNEWHPDLLVWEKNSGGRSADVGSRPNGRSWVNAYDMAGNVWEWCSSLYKVYPYRLDDGRENPNGTEVRVLRGGAWKYDLAYWFRTAFRSFYLPNLENDRRGFRCVRAVI